jgi:putative Holliday junction resolvase
MEESAASERTNNDGNSGRVVALDYGRARIGVAASDPTRCLASPHSVVANDPPPARPPEALLDVILQLRPFEIVIGIPLNMDGSRGEMADEAAEFGRSVGLAAGVPVVEWDERLSTVRAERTMRDAGHRRQTQRDRGHTDAISAAHTLQGYLDRSVR